MALTSKIMASRVIVAAVFFPNKSHFFFSTISRNTVLSRSSNLSEVNRYFLFGQTYIFMVDPRLLHATLKFKRTCTTDRDF